MIKKIACVSVLAAALLAAAPAAQAASAPAQAASAPVPSAGAPGAGLLHSVLGALEVGNPVASPSKLLPSGLLGR
ncbi:hypothetical protein [Streptomyces apricus]|uniref:Secreted protein n=1 Tax=Streptomyces apricus TaxID=1828112 RepID=A0A5B0AJ33_9ACTN|nr:hypothetical protein [Streptomyces apricus]KAA0929844.1 hypothetical protein FGF04_30175 [Streptomyces apricus]